jgi:hypothetical protein
VSERLTLPKGVVGNFASLQASLAVTAKIGITQV